MWRDIARYSRVERLELTNFLPCKASSWLEPEWAGFLDRLKELSLQAYGCDTGGVWQANSMKGFNAFYKEMPRFLFAHAKRLEHLEIVSHSSGYLGSDALRFAPHTLPRLRTLRLEDVCITASLGEFLGELSPNLESLRLEGCTAVGCPTSRPGTPNNPKWGDFWKAVREGSPVLRVVICEHTEILPLADDRITDEDEIWVVWPYIDIDAPYGFVSDCLEVTQERLAAGDDNREYRLLMEELAKRQQSI